MKISVVTPSSNQGAYVGRCIQSVMDSTHRPIEHLILDNCSADGTPGELQRYLADPCGVELKVWSEPDEGQSQAINKGFRLATGEILCWLNTDEAYLPETLSIVADYFDKHPSVDVVFGDCIFLAADGTAPRRRRAFKYSKRMLLYYGSYIPSCATFVRRYVVDRGFLLDESLRVCMDYDWYLRLADAGFRFAHIPRPLARFTWHDSNISRTLIRLGDEESRRLRLAHGGGIGPERFRLFCFKAPRDYYRAQRLVKRFGLSCVSSLTRVLRHRAKSRSSKRSP